MEFSLISLKRNPLPAACARTASMPVLAIGARPMANLVRHI
ncbi:hypothetical protein [Mesorhizobium sp.]|nr:hypothetical protein [Mesorhizobium sp.]